MHREKHPKLPNLTNKFPSLASDGQPVNTRLIIQTGSIKLSIGSEATKTQNSRNKVWKKPSSLPTKNIVLDHLAIQEKQVPTTYVLVKKRKHELYQPVSHIDVLQFKEGRMTGKLIVCMEKFVRNSFL
jgi:hypothetical protein